GNYHGLRNRMSVLLEAYSYASYRDRVECTLEFTRECLAFAAEHADEIRAINARAAEETVERGRSFDERDLIPVRAALAAFDEHATLLTYEAHEDQRAVWEAVRESALRNEVPDLGAPLDLRVQHFGRYEPSLLIVRPLEYAIPPGHDNVIENL